MESYANGSTSEDDNTPSVEVLKEPAFPLKTMPVHANGWLNDMKISSPTAIRVNIGNNVAFDPIYRAWIKKYPSALNTFETIVAYGKGKKIVLFLDYDGTLSPIVDEPDHAVMSDQMREVVRSAALHLPTAIITGRSCDKVFDFVKLTELYYAGSHGMDIMSPVGKTGSTYIRRARGPGHGSRRRGCAAVAPAASQDTDRGKMAEAFVSSIAQPVPPALLQTPRGGEPRRTRRKGQSARCVRRHSARIAARSWPRGSTQECARQILMKRLGVLEEEEDGSASDDHFLRYVQLFQGPLTDDAITALTALCGLESTPELEIAQD